MTDTVLGLLIAAALISLGLSLLGLFTDRRHTPRQPTRATIAGPDGHDLIPVLVAHHPQACARCSEVYDNELMDGLEAAERFANGERGAA